MQRVEQATRANDVQSALRGRRPYDDGAVVGDAEQRAARVTRIARARLALQRQWHAIYLSTLKILHVFAFNPTVCNEGRRTTVFKQTRNGSRTNAKTHDLPVGTIFIIAHFDDETVNLF